MNPEHIESHLKRVHARTLENNKTIKRVSALLTDISGQPVKLSVNDNGCRYTVTTANGKFKARSRELATLCNLDTDTLNSIIDRAIQL